MGDFIESLKLNMIIIDLFDTLIYVFGLLKYASDFVSQSSTQFLIIDTCVVPFLMLIITLLLPLLFLTSDGSYYELNQSRTLGTVTRWFLGWLVSYIIYVVICILVSYLIHIPYTFI